jgi:hypothetical protein
MGPGRALSLAALGWLRDGDAPRPLAYDGAEEEDCMARLRHFAVVVKDLDKAAAFYQDVFELTRVGR